jgi:hypothetical protein
MCRKISRSDWIVFFIFQIDFVDDKQERCRIVFNLLEEQHGTDTRKIRRKVVDSLLPDVSY